MKRLTRDQLAARVARDIPEGAYVNLGIGLPTTVANHLPVDREIFLQSENGLLGMGPAPARTSIGWRCSPGRSRRTGTGSFEISTDVRRVSSQAMRR